jgi:chromosome segregation ATPase
MTMNEFSPVDAARVAKELIEESASLAPDDPRRVARLASSLMAVYLGGKSDRVTPPPPADRVTAEELADVARLDAKMREDTFAEPANSYAALAAKGPTLLPKLAAEVTALRVELADAREVNAELRRQAEHDKRRDELAHVELATLREERGRLRAEHDAIGRAIDEAGIGVNGPDDTLVARVDRLIADANEEGDKLEALREKARAVCEADAALIERIDLDTCDAVNDAIDALRAEVDKP